MIKKTAKLFMLSIVLLNLYLTTLYSDELTVKSMDVNGNLETVLSNTIMVRFTTSSEKENLGLLSLDFDMISIEPLLPKSQQIRYNEKRQLNLLNTNNNIELAKLLMTEDVLARTFIIQYNSKLTPEKYCKEICKNSSIEVAEPYRVFHIQAYQPNDPYLGNQAGLAAMQVLDAWEIEKGDPNVIVGISDSGVLQTHEDLIDAIVVNDGEIPNNGIDDDENGYIDDYTGYNFNHPIDGQGWGNVTPNAAHGTEVAGIASAVPDNNIGLAGYGYNTSILPMLVTYINPDGGPEVLHGYKSLLYAVERGCKVLNLSWGNPLEYSSIEESIIDYAIANDVAIVASAGNQNHRESNIATYYPAAYRGVLGVGWTTNDVINLGSSSLGVSCDIFAPSGGYSTTTGASNMSYTSNLPGTSFAAPVVSGAVALVRSHFPNLDAMQSLEVVRQQGDDISATNPNVEYEKLFVKRVNLYKPLICDPFSFPGIRPVEIITKDSKGNIKENFQYGDTVYLTIKAKNHLGAANNLKFSLSIGYSQKTVGVIHNITAEITGVNVEENSDFEIGPFVFITAENEHNKIIMRVDIEGENDYHDFFKFDFIPTPDFHSFSNEKIAFSMLYDGKFGFNSNGYDEPLGAGFNYKEQGNQLYDARSGIIACEAMKKARYAYDDVFNFNVVKNIGTGDNPNQGILRSPSGDLGMEITQTTGFISDTAKSAYIDIELKALRYLENPAIGYIFELDIMQRSGDNLSFYFDEAIPEEYKSKAAAQAAIYTLDDNTPWIGVGCISDEENAIPASAGLDYSLIYNFEKYEIIQSLTSGVTMQTQTPDDISVVVGMGYSGVVKVDEIKKCRVCLAAGNTKAELIHELRLCLGIPDTTDAIDEELSELMVYPNPAKDYFILSEDMIWDDVQIFDILGKEYFIEYANNIFDISDLPIGSYCVKISNNKKYYTKTLQILR